MDTAESPGDRRVSLTALGLALLASLRLHVPLGWPPWPAPVLVALCALYVWFGYRGFRWCVAALLVAGTLRAWFGPAGNGGSTAQSLVFGVAGLAGAILLALPAVRRFGDRRRRERTPDVPYFFVAVWMVLLAVLAVLLWSRVVGEVLL